MKRSVKEQRERAVKKIKRKRQTAADTTETVSAHYPDRLSEERDYKVRKLENVQKQKDTFFEGDEPCARGDQKETASRVSLSSPKTYACPVSSQEEESDSFFKLLGLQRGLSSTALLNTLMMQGKKKMIMKISAEAITSSGRVELMLLFSFSDQSIITLEQGTLQHCIFRSWNYILNS